MFPSFIRIVREQTGKEKTRKVTRREGKNCPVSLNFERRREEEREKIT